MKPQRTYILLFPFFFRIMLTKVVIAVDYESPILYDHVLKGLKTNKFKNVIC